MGCKMLNDRLEVAARCLANKKLGDDTAWILWNQKNTISTDDLSRVDERAEQIKADVINASIYTYLNLEL